MYMDTNTYDTDTYKDTDKDTEADNHTLKIQIHTEIQIKIYSYI